MGKKLKNEVITAEMIEGFKKYLIKNEHTSYLSTSEYGNADLINTTISLLFPIFSFGFCEAVMRFTITKHDNAKSMLVVALGVTIVGSILTFCLTEVFRQVKFLNNYLEYLPILFFCNSIHRMLQQYSKGMDKNSWFVIDGIICALLQVIFTIIFIVELHLGVKGYIYSLVLAYAVSSAVLLIGCRVIATLKTEKIYKKEIKSAIKYGLPLMSEEVSWWIIQGSDRYMVAWICGSAANGLYSIAYKIPALYNVLVTVFIQAFSITSFKELDNKGYVDGKADGRCFNYIYKLYVAATFISAGLIILLTKFISGINLKNEFYNSWRYTPILICAFAVGNLQNFYGAIYKGLKKSSQIFISTLAAAVVNIILNLILIYKIGTIGASI